MAEVSRQLDHANARIACGQPRQNRRRPVGAAVVDIDDLQLEAFLSAKRLHQALVGQLDHVLLVETGYDNGDERPLAPTRIRHDWFKPPKLQSLRVLGCSQWGKRAAKKRFCSGICAK